MRTIRVTGKGKLKVHPDMTRITIDLEGQYKDYARTLQRSSEDTEALKKLLSRYGFERKDLKTLSFNVETVYDRYEEKDVYKQKFAGYKYTHRMKIEFDSDNSRLGEILFGLASSELSPEFRISYTIKDPEAAKNELLGRAVRDSASKAAILSKAAGLELGEIQSMDYSWGEIDFEVRPMNKLCMPDCDVGFGGYDMDIEPDDIDLEDTVTVVWEIR